jgi:hypothetical protein
MAVEQKGNEFGLSVLGLEVVIVVYHVSRRCAYSWLELVEGVHSFFRGFWWRIPAPASITAGARTRLIVVEYNIVSQIQQ